MYTWQKVRKGGIRVLKPNPSFYRNVCVGSTSQRNLFSSVWLHSAKNKHMILQGRD